MSKKRRTFSAEFKAKVGLEALRGVESAQVSVWKKQLAERLPEIFAKPLAQPRGEIAQV